MRKKNRFAINFDKNDENCEQFQKSLKLFVIEWKSLVLSIGRVFVRQAFPFSLATENACRQIQCLMTEYWSLPSFEFIQRTFGVKISLACDSFFLETLVTVERDTLVEVQWSGTSFYTIFTCRQHRTCLLFCKPLHVLLLSKTEKEEVRVKEK